MYKSQGDDDVYRPLDDRGYPSGFAFASADQAAVSFYGEAYYWNPRQPTLGPAIAGGLDMIAPDRRGGFVGARSTYLDDGGAGPIQILAVPAADAGDAGPRVLVENPFSQAGGFLGGIEAWP